MVGYITEDDRADKKTYADYGYGLAGAALGFGAETSLHAMRLIMSGVFDRYPTLKIILGHLGEALPFWLDRLDRQSTKHGVKVKLQRKVSEYIKDNFIMTFSGMFFTPAFFCVYLALGADNILFASDYPLEPMRDATEFVERLPICDGDKEKICFGNAGCNHVHAWENKFSKSIEIHELFGKNNLATIQ